MKYLKLKSCGEKEIVPARQMAREIEILRIHDQNLPKIAVTNNFPFYIDLRARIMSKKVFTKSLLKNKISILCLTLGRVRLRLFWNKNNGITTRFFFGGKFRKIYLLNFDRKRC